MSPATGENAFTVTLTMRAAKPCSVRGYPRVTLLDNRGSRVPFGVVRGRGQYISNRPPQWVDLQPGERVFTEVAKYRCDTAHYQRARTARLVVAGSRITMLVPVNVTMDYCGRGDPGSTVQVAALTGHLSGVFP